jgi:diguanylate cyclase (GGDEF)-like protein
MWIAIGLPLAVTCAVHTCLVVSRESEAASDALIDRARAGAMSLQSFTESHSYSDFAEFVDALQSENHDARDNTKGWSTSLMNRSDVIGVALLNAHGDVLLKWPAELAIDFAAPGVDAESVPSVHPLESSASGDALLDVDGSITIAAVQRGPELAPLAYVSIATVSPNVWTPTAQQIMPLIVLLGLSALVTGALIQRSIETSVSAPLAVLARQMRAQGPGEAIEFDENAAAELAQIARSFGELQDELHESRRQSVVLERRVESSAAEETRKIQRLLTRARKDAEHDSLTGLTNRRFIEERLEPIFQEQISQRVNVVIAMFDVDNFKPLNDTEGHAAGDQILRFLGELLRGTLREDDVGVRYGGDEFAAILMDISERQAHEVCDRIVKLFNRQIGAMNIKTKVTLSSGFASRSATDARTATELLSQADAALYKAKRSGKGCVVEFETK